MYFRRAGSPGADLQEPINQAKRTCVRDRKISQHGKANYGILAEKGIYPQSGWEEIRQVGNIDLLKKQWENLYQTVMRKLRLNSLAQVYCNY